MQTQLQKLSVRFVERSVEDIARLRSHLEDARAGDSAALQQLQQLAHRMHGTGATFGFATVSAGAEKIERLARRCADLSVGLDSELFEQFRDGLARLEQELGKLASSLS